MVRKTKSNSNTSQMQNAEDILAEIAEIEEKLVKEHGESRKTDDIIKVRASIMDEINDDFNF